MTSIRIPDTVRGYTVIPNGLLPTGDAKISARSWGIYAYLLSRPPGWECRALHLASVFREGRDAVYAALRELAGAGLMVKEGYLDEGMPRQRYALADFPVTDSQEPGMPDADLPDSEIPGQVTTEPSLTTETTQVSPIAEPGDRGTPRLQVVADDDPTWARFWSLYPRKQGKADARKAWTRALVKADADVILRGATRFAGGVRDLKFCPYPATWLNGERWNDEPLPDARPGAASYEHGDGPSRVMTPDEWERNGTRG